MPLSDYAPFASSALRPPPADQGEGGGGCTKCIVPSTFPGVTFEDGVCTFCRNHAATSGKKAPPLGQEALRQALTAKPSSTQQCVVALSGGKDSSFVLYYIVRELQLRPLAVFFDNGYVTDVAHNNIATLCSKLDVELVTRKATPYRGKLIRQCLAQSKYKDDLGICFNCENNLRTATILEATARGIPFIVWGSTDFEDSYPRFLQGAGKTFREERKSSRKSIFASVKSLVSQALGGGPGLRNKAGYLYHYLLAKYLLVRDNVRTGAPEGWRVLDPFLVVSFQEKKPEVVYFFDYIQYDPPHMVAVLREKLGWSTPEGKPARFDCKLGALSNYRHFLKTGMSKDGFTLSVLVRNGLMSRDEAAAREKEIRAGLARECERLVAEIEQRA